MAATDTRASFSDLEGEGIFRPSDLVTAAGTGHNGQLLVDTLAATMPPALEVVLTQRENLELGRGRAGRRGPDGEGVRRKQWEGIAEFAGLDGVKLADVAVRGGADEDGNNVDSSQAWITFVYYDDRGDVLKGAIPYAQYADEADEDDDRDPILQSEALAKTAAARDHAAAQEKARAAAEADEDARPAGGMPDLSDASWAVIVTYMDEHPDQADAIIAFEQASRGDKARKRIVQWESEETEGGNGNGDGNGEAEAPEGGGEAAPEGGGEEPDPLTDVEQAEVARLVAENEGDELSKLASDLDIAHTGSKAEIAERLVRAQRDAPTA